jgi:MFS family permease
VTRVVWRRAVAPKLPEYAVAVRARRPLVPRLPRDAWVVLGGDALSAVGSGLTLPFLLVYLNRIRDIDVAVAALALSTVALAGFAGNPAGGWLIDRIGAKRALACGLSVAAVGAFLVTLVREPWHAFVVAAVVGFGAAVVWPAQDSLLAVVVERKERSSVFAVRNATLNAGYGVGAVGASLIVDVSSPGSFVMLYLLDGLSFLAFIPILAVVLRSASVPDAREPAPRAEKATGYRDVLRDRSFVRVWVLFALLVTVGFSQTQAGFPAYAVGAGGLSAAGLSIAFAANTFTVVGGQLAVLRWMEGRLRTTGIELACACWAMAWGLTLLAGTFGGGTPAILGFSTALVVFAIGETLLAPSQAALVNDMATDELRGRYNGLYSVAWTTGFALGPAWAGVALAVGNGTALFGGLIAGCGLAALAATRLARQLPSAVNLVPAAPVADD